MNILDILSKGDGLKKSEISGFMMPTKKNPPLRNGNEWLKTYNTNPRMAPVTKMALDIASSGGSVFKVMRDGTEKEVRDHALTDLLYDANLMWHTSGGGNLYMSQVHYLVLGESFAIIDRDKATGDPAMLWWVPPTWVTDTPHGEDQFYIVKNPNGKEFKVDARDMFYRKNPNPEDPTARGVGRVMQIGDEIETDEYMAKFIKRFFYNDATPNLIITAPEGATDEQIERAEKKWYQKFMGYNNSNKTAFLNWEAKITMLNNTSKEMDFLESRKFYRDLAMQHFGIPPEIMGNVENSNKATVVAAQDIYIREVLEPQLKDFEEAITRQLLTQYNRSKGYIFKFTRLIVEDREWDLKKTSAGLDKGAITINEWRQANDFPPLPDNQGNKLLIPSNRTIVDLDTDDPFNAEQEETSSDILEEEVNEETDDANDDETSEESKEANKKAIMAESKVAAKLLGGGKSNEGKSKEQDQEVITFI